MLSCFSHIWFFVTSQTIARQAPLSVGFSRQEYWSELLFSPPGDLPDPGIDSCIAGGFFTIEPPGKHSQRIDNWYYLFLKYLAHFLREGSQAWRFLCGKVFNYSSNLREVGVFGLAVTSQREFLHSRSSKELVHFIWAVEFDMFITFSFILAVPRGLLSI